MKPRVSQLIERLEQTIQDLKGNDIEIYCEEYKLTGEVEYVAEDGEKPCIELGGNP